MSEPTRLLRASLIAPLPATGVIIVLCMLVLLIEKPAMPSDDAPLRAAGALLMLSPAFYAITAAVLYFSARAMAVAGVLSSRGLVYLACTASFAFGLYFGLQSPMVSRFDPISAVIFGAIVLAVSVPMVLLWWRLAQRGLSSTASGGSAKLE